MKVQAIVVEKLKCTVHLAGLWRRVCEDDVHLTGGKPVYLGEIEGARGDLEDKRYAVEGEWQGIWQRGGFFADPPTLPSLSSPTPPLLLTSAFVPSAPLYPVVTCMASAFLCCVCTFAAVPVHTLMFPCCIFIHFASMCFSSLVPNHFTLFLFSFLFFVLSLFLFAL